MVIINYSWFNHWWVIGRGFGKLTRTPRPPAAACCVRRLPRRGRRCCRCCGAWRCCCRAVARRAQGSPWLRRSRLISWGSRGDLMGNSWRIHGLILLGSHSVFLSSLLFIRPHDIFVWSLLLPRWVSLYHMFVVNCCWCCLCTWILFAYCCWCRGRCHDELPIQSSYSCRGFMVPPSSGPPLGTSKPCTSIGATCCMGRTLDVVKTPIIEVFRTRTAMLGVCLFGGCYGLPSWFATFWLLMSRSFWEQIITWAMLLMDTPCCASCTAIATITIRHHRHWLWLILTHNHSASWLAPLYAHHCTNHVAISCYPASCLRFMAATSPVHC